MTASIVTSPESYNFFYLPVDDTTLKSECYLTGIGQGVYPPNTPYPSSGHPPLYDFSWKNGRILSDFALVLITEGRGRFESKSIPLRTVHPGTCMILVPGRKHRYQPMKKYGWVEKWVTLNGKYVHKLRQQNYLPNSSELLPIRDSELERRFDILFAEVARTPEVNNLQLSMQAIELFSRAAKGVPQNHRNERPYDTLQDSLVRDAYHFIQTNCHRPIRIHDIVAHFNVTRRTLERRFSQQTGQTLNNTLIHARMQRVKMLLSDSDIMVKEIAYSCGFNSPQRMIQDFKMQFGMTPTEFREKHY